jgi:hypothetical protein
MQLREAAAEAGKLLRAALSSLVKAVRGSIETARTAAGDARAAHEASYAQVRPCLRA